MEKNITELSFNEIQAVVGGSAAVNLGANVAVNSGTMAAPSYSAPAPGQSGSITLSLGGIKLTIPKV